MKQNKHEIGTNYGRMPESDYQKMIEVEAYRTRREMKRWEKFAEKLEKRQAAVPESEAMGYERVLDSQEGIKEMKARRNAFKSGPAKLDRTRSAKKRELTLRDKSKVETGSREEESNVLPFSMKRPVEAPWNLKKIADKYPIGSYVQGIVESFSQEGVLIQLENGIKGLNPLSEISLTGTIEDPKELFRIGDRIEATVIGIDLEKHLIGLSMRETIRKNQLEWESVA